MKRIETPDYPIMFKVDIVREATKRVSVIDYLLVNVANGSGTMNVNGIDYPLDAGEVYLIARFEKVQFKTEESLQLTQIRLSEDAVEEYLLRNKPVENQESRIRSVIQLPRHLLVDSIFSGIESGVNNGYRVPMSLVFLKMQECIGILTYVCPALYDWFSKMNSVQKINLREFMETHYMDNLPLEQLAMASGRSLSTFRRDFLKEFGTTPGKWLLKKRLKEAYRLITQCHKSPSTFLYELGFESFPHFSRCFKSIYGIQPSILLKNSVVTSVTAM